MNAARDERASVEPPRPGRSARPAPAARATGAADRLPSELESLLFDLGAPLGSALLVHQPEAGVLVEVARRVEAGERPEIDAAVVMRAAEVDARRKQRPADAATTEPLGDDEPAQVRAVGPGVRAVDRDRAVHAILPFVVERQPQRVALVARTLAEFGELAGDLRLEADAEPDSRVVARVQLGDAADRAG